MKRIALVIVLLALFIVAGILSMYVGAPMDVSDLRNSKGGKVKVVGSYGGHYVTNGYVYILLVGQDGYTIVGVIPYKQVLKLAGPYFQFGDTLIVEGIYDPSRKTLNITAILKGCHSAYYNPVK